MNNQQLVNVFEEIIKVFSLKGTLVGFHTIKAGNINDTYCITTDDDGAEKQYIVQRVNHKVFSDPERIANNVCLVTRHIENKLRESGVADVRRRVVRYYQMADGSFYYVTADGCYWRVLSYVFNSINHSQPTRQILKSTGEAFGAFQRQLSDFPAEMLYETISGFHDTEKRFSDLFAAAKADVAGRLDEVREELEYLMSMKPYISLFREKSERGEIPLRVVHNDTKCNNVMFDNVTGEPLAVIDLDTVMPGYVGYDFGDAVRFAANTAAEDEKDLSKVSLDMDLYDAFAEGFVPQVQGMITEEEVRTLPDGVLIITLELAARFLTDYLNGDVYFKCKKEHHNLLRTRAQVCLAKDVFKKMPQMREHLKLIIDRIAEKKAEK